MGTSKRLLDVRCGRGQLCYKEDLFFPTWPLGWFRRWSHNATKYSYDCKSKITYTHTHISISIKIFLGQHIYVECNWFCYYFQSALRSMKYSSHLVKVAFQSMLEILKQEIITSYSVRDVIWGIDHPLVKLANDILPKVNN